MRRATVNFVNKNKLNIRRNYHGDCKAYACCEYNGIYGRIKSEWHRENGNTTYRITVPANVTVRAILPDGEHILSSGEYAF